MSVFQKILNTAVNRLREQGTIAFENGTCAYRTRHGLVCAVGALISDEVYNEDKEGSSASELIPILQLSGWDIQDDSQTREFLDHMQSRLHDSYPEVEYGLSYTAWLEKQLPKFCDEFHLDIPPK